MRVQMMEAYGEIWADVSLLKCKVTAGTSRPWQLMVAPKWTCSEALHTVVLREHLLAMRGINESMNQIYVFLDLF